MISGKLDTAYILFLGFLAGSILFFYFYPSTIDIHLHDTMFVLSTSRLLLFPVAGYFVILFAASHYLSKVIGKTSVFQWIAFASAAILTFLLIGLSGKNSSLAYLDLSFWSFYNKVIKFISIVFLLFLAVQTTFWLFWLFTIVRHIFLKPDSPNFPRKT